jgi:hypothetical protein
MCVSVSVCLAVLRNTNVVTKYDSVSGIAIDCLLFLFDHQPEFPPLDAARIPSHEEEIPQAIVALRLPAGLTD